MALTPFENKYNPFTNRKHHRLFDGTWTYTNRPLSQNPDAVRKRKERQRNLTLIDARICMICSYAFISRGGQNACSMCWKTLCRLYRRSQKRFRGKCHLALVRPWAQQMLNCERLDVRTRSARIPIPDLSSSRVQDAIHRTMELMKKSAEDGIWYVDQMPRLPLPPYRVEP